MNMAWQLRFILITFFVSVFPLLSFAQNNCNQKPNAAKLAELEQLIRAKDSTSFILSQNGRILKRYVVDNHRQPIKSITKTITSLVIGTMLDRHEIASLDTKASTWLPQFRNDPQKQNITLRMLLSMTSGLEDPADFWGASANNAVNLSLNLPLVSPPGTGFHYSNASTMLLAPIIQQISQNSVTKLAWQRIFSPLGITDWAWLSDSAFPLTASGLLLSPTDLLKIGELFLGMGKYHQHRIVSERYFTEAITPSTIFDRYGLSFWLDYPTLPPSSRIFYAEGIGGQFVIADPETCTIAVRTRKMAPNESLEIREANWIHELPLLLYQLFPRTGASTSTP